MSLNLQSAAQSMEKSVSVCVCLLTSGLFTMVIIYLLICMICGHDTLPHASIGTLPRQWLVELALVKRLRRHAHDAYALLWNEKLPQKNLAADLSAPKSQQFLRFAMPIADPRNRAISETRDSNAALRFKSAMESR